MTLIFGLRNDAIVAPRVFGSLSRTVRLEPILMEGIVVLTNPEEASAKTVRIGRVLSKRGLVTDGVTRYGSFQDGQRPQVLV